MESGVEEEVRKSVKLGPEFSVSVKEVVGRRGGGEVVVARQRIEIEVEEEVRSLEVWSRRHREGRRGFIMLRRRCDRSRIGRDLSKFGEDAEMQFFRAKILGFKI